jgi:hypothetical protein
MSVSLGCLMQRYTFLKFLVNIVKLLFKYFPWEEMYFFFVVLGIKSRVLCILSIHSTTELHFGPRSLFEKTCFEIILDLQENKGSMESFHVPLP